MAFKRARIISLIFVGIFIYYFTMDYTLINIEKTALIITLGIDNIEEGYEITAQIAIPEATNQKATNNESVISASGKSLYEAVSKIGEMTGWYPKLSFCNLIVLGESVLNENVMNVLDFFLRSYKVEDSAILCSCEGLAKELLLSSSPLDNISGLSLSKIFVRDYKDASRVLTSSIKSFSIGYYSRSNLGYMPFVKTVKTDESGKGGKTSSASTTIEPNTGGSGEKSGESGGSQELVIYNADTCILFDKGYKKTELTGDETLCYSLLYKNVKESYFNVNAIDNEGNSGVLLISVSRTSNKVYLAFENEVPVLHCDLKVWLRVLDTNFAQDVKTLSNLGELNEITKYFSKQYIENNLQSVVSKCKNAGVDIFEVKNLLYRFHNSKYESHKDSILNNFKVKFNIQCLNFV